MNFNDLFQPGLYIVVLIALAILQFLDSGEPAHE